MREMKRHREMQKAESRRQNVENTNRIGLIAGWGELPIVLARALKQQGAQVYCVALKDHADAGLEQICDGVQWTSVSKIGQAIRYLKRSGVCHATMAGKVFKRRLFDRGAWRRFWPDW